MQTVLGPKPTPNPGLVCVLVLLRDPGKDEFYTLRFKDLQDHFARNYKGSRRPKNPKSTNCPVWPKELEAFRNWDALLAVLKNATPSSNPSLKRTGIGKPAPSA